MKRLIDELPGGFETDLLRAADSEAPSAAARSRALGAALGVLGAATVAATASAQAASATTPLASGAAAAKASATLWIAKALVIVSLGGLAAGGALYGGSKLRSEPPPARVVSPPKVNAPEPRPVVTALPVRQLEPPLRPRPRKVAFVAAAAPPPPEPTRAASLSEQIRLIDAARTALARNDAAAALAALAAYRSEWPEGAFAMEADLLQIEALLAADRRTEAVTLARRLAAANPGAAYRARLAPLLEP